ncbi:calcium-binding EF-hand domain-containing protein, partial [Pseudohyphozyma bogoriensis]
GQKSMSGEVATAIWDIVLAPRYPVGKDFVEYTKSLGSNFKGVSFDVWSQLLEFVTTVGDDLNGYNEDDAWPSVLDSFVEWGNEQKKSS